MKKQYLLGSFVVLALLIPVLVSAATADEIRAQIQSLLSQISALQAQLITETSDTTITTSTSTACPNLYRTLSRGSRGSDVISLQQFLIAEGLLSSDSASGFFGPLTESAVQRWQAQNGIDAVGVVGARTRAAIAARCATKPSVVQPCAEKTPPLCTNGTLVSNGTDANGCSLGYQCKPSTSCPVYDTCSAGFKTDTSTDVNGCIKISCTSWLLLASLDVSPRGGKAPLKVTFTAATDVEFRDGTMIEFGDGNTTTLKPGAVAKNIRTVSHEYTKAGTYVANLVGLDKGDRVVLGTEVIIVSEQDVFTATTPTSGPAPLTVIFSGSTAGSHFGGVVVDYGDGSRESLCSPGGGCSNKLSHTYAKAGAYTAAMIGIGEGSSGTLKTLVITVGAGATPTASLFSATPTSGPAPLTVRFTGIGSGASIDLGNGVTSQWIDGTPSYINYTYQTAGTYTATLRGQGGALGTVTITAY